jgi:hypothetical protein
MGKWENEEMGEWGNEEMGEWENGPFDRLRDRCRQNFYCLNQLE